MIFYSTHQKSPAVSFREAVLKGLADDGGLFLPADVPLMPPEFWKKLAGMSLSQVALHVSTLLLGEEIAEERLKEIVEGAFDFDVPVVQLSEQLHVLELSYGPTLSFKDFGARFLARVMSYFIQESNHMLTILVATSGDTGSAVAHGFLNVVGTRVVLLYPSGGVSEIQEKQLTTCSGNITALEIQGTFDDCQALVKHAFLDRQLRERVHLTSANSMNVGRLLPQCFYYFYAFGKLEGMYSKIVFSVPSGNYGNLTAGLIARKMGLPVSRFVAATNRNDVVPEYLETGVFRPRPSVSTVSNAMDVGNPSNFGRMLALYDQDVGKMKEDIWGKSYSDEQTKAAMQELLARYGYVSDPHGAVGYLGLKDYLQGQQEGAGGIFLETAHPAKFAPLIREVLGRDVEMPEQLKSCWNKPKQSTLLAADYKTFRSFLLSL